MILNIIALQIIRKILSPTAVTEFAMELRNAMTETIKTATDEILSENLRITGNVSMAAQRAETIDFNDQMDTN
jgi:hypothetical protein